ncbi:MAG: hypothetical protein B7Z72_14890, partial [Gemmatimonadetes bacterium 21-71-4]
WDLNNQGRGSANGYPGSKNLGYSGPVWWDGTANDTTPNPTGGKTHPASYPVAFPTDLALTAGTLSNAQVMDIEAYETVGSSPMRQLHAMAAYVVRAADFKVYWGSTAGVVDSVIDVSDHVAVPFNAKIRASWGILNDSSFTNTTEANTYDGSNAVLSWEDVFCIDPGPAVSGKCTGTPPAFLMNHARLSPVVFATSPSGTTFTAASATGNGFIFYIAGQYFLMQMAALPQSTVWNLRTYSGTVMGSPGSFKFLSQPRPPAVPGLKLQITFQPSVVTATSDTAVFANIHTVPDPYYVTNSLETSPNSKVLRFVNVPSQCIIRIYSVSGILIRVLSRRRMAGPRSAGSRWSTSLSKTSRSGPGPRPGPRGGSHA